MWMDVRCHHWNKFNNLPWLFLAASRCDSRQRQRQFLIQWHVHDNKFCFAQALCKNVTRRSASNLYSDDSFSMTCPLSGHQREEDVSSLCIHILHFSLFMIYSYQICSQWNLYTLGFWSALHTWHVWQVCSSSERGPSSVALPEFSAFSRFT